MTHNNIIVIEACLFKDSVTNFWSSRKDNKHNCGIIRDILILKMMYASIYYTGIITIIIINHYYHEIKNEVLLASN